MCYLWPAIVHPVDNGTAKDGVDLAVAWVGMGGALAGAVVGGVITVVVACMSQRSLDKQAERTRQRHVADRRFDVHNEYLTRVNTFSDKALSLWTALEDDHADELKKAAHDQYIESWHRYYQSSTGPQLTGPHDLSIKSRELADAVVNYANALDAWFADGSKPNTRAERKENCDTLRKAVDAKRRTYVTAAQDVFSK